MSVWMLFAPVSKKEASFLSSSFKVGLRDSSKILVVRADRIGDVVLSTPIFELLKKYYPRSHVTALVQPNVIPLLKGLSTIDQFFVFEPKGLHAGFKGFLNLYRQFKKEHFTVALVLQSHWKIGLALFLARIRHRIGPWSHIYSYFFYNRGLRQGRSSVEMHEADYNIQLLRRLGIRVQSRVVPTRIFLSEDIKTQTYEWLKAKGWDPNQPLVGVNPGMGGSALNWPEEHYIELISHLVQQGLAVLVTGGVKEGPLLDSFEKKLRAFKSQILFYQATPTAGVDFLAGLLSHTKVVIAPSTGPLHIAVALEKKVVTFFPPIRVQSAIRWGPYLQEETQVAVMVPDVYCGQDFSCLGSLCHYYPCMKSLSVKEALDKVNGFL